MNMYNPNSNAMENGTEYSTGTKIEHEKGYKVNPFTDIKFAPKNTKFDIEVVVDFSENQST